MKNILYFALCLVAYSSVTFGYTAKNAVYQFKKDGAVKTISTDGNSRTFQSDPITATNTTDKHVITLSISGTLDYVINDTDATKNTITLKGTKTTATPPLDGADVNVESYDVKSMTVNITVDPKGTSDDKDGNKKSNTLSATLSYDSTTQLDGSCNGIASETKTAQELKDGETGVGVYVALSSAGKLLICK